MTFIICLQSAGVGICSKCTWEVYLIFVILLVLILSCYYFCYYYLHIIEEKTGQIKWGTEVTPHSRPYMAFVRFYDNKLNILITSPFCNGSKMNVTLGAHDINKKENTQQVIPVLQAIRHENFNTETFTNDIMLLKLKYKAQLNAYVDTIALPHSEDWVRPGYECSVVDWGKQTNGKLTNTLRKVDVEVQNEQKCKHFFPYYHDIIQLCVGNPNSKKTTDNGDAGGPLVCNNMSQGMVSYGHVDGKPPQVVTRISSFVPWIKRTIKRLEHH
uniref:Peptidase S1 domain-containing protein n=1 Tax=Castor canadensis TaxID=51338 RepID=A0A8C0WHI8_CASCN